MMITVTKPVDRCLCPMAHLGGTVPSPDVKHIDVYNEHDNQLKQRCPVERRQFTTYIRLNQVGMNRFVLRAHGDDTIDEVNLNLEYVPQKNNHCVKLVYLICRDEDDDDDDDEVSSRWFDEGRFEAPRNEDCSVGSACRRISTVALMAQYFFAVTLGTTFRLELNRWHRPVVHRFVLDHHTCSQLWSLSQEDLWREVAQELMASPLAADAQEEVKFIALCSFSRFHFDPDKPYEPEAQVKGYVSLGASGLALLSTQSLYTWPEFPRDIAYHLRDTRCVDSTKFMNDSANRSGNRSECFWNTLGALIHEVAHMFDLGHSSAGMMSGQYWKVGHFFQRPRAEAHLWWSASQTEILLASPWLNTVPLHKDLEAFQLENECIHAKHGLRLVEYREGASRMVLRSTIFDCAITELRLEPPPTAGLLYALDIYGNHFKHELT